MKPEQIWQAALGELQLQMTKATFDTWFKTSRVVAYEDGTFVIGVSSAYAKDWLENRLSGAVKRTLNGIAGRSVEVRYMISTQASQDEAPAAADLGPLLSGVETERALQATTASDGLSFKYTFETFIVGPNNRLAHAASLAAAENPAQAYNPLFLYGGVGLGKTHLLHAIGQTCRTRGLHVLYVSSEEFTNDLINAIRARTTDAFRDKYRTIDVLLIDDIQFIAGKESTQEEFFHTFNTLHGQDKQLVISSDRPPKAMSTLEERLRSRFEWGLIADIQPPDLETRMAILRFKADSLRAQFPDAVLQYIAREVHSNIRELEGALNRVLATARLTNQAPTVELAASALADLVPQRSARTPEEIVAAVAAYYGLDILAITGRSRNAEIALPRHIAMFLLREEIALSLPQIGATLGGRDHTTALHGCERVTDLIERDSNVRRDVMAIRSRLYQQKV
jgi:chromosomal replication initiator protein